MSAAALTDAAITRMIRHILTSSATCSDTLLLVADGLEDAAAHVAEGDAATYLRGHAENLRRIAPYMAETLMVVERA
jgi:hypothetical protein